MENLKRNPLAFSQCRANQTIALRKRFGFSCVHCFVFTGCVRIKTCSADHGLLENPPAFKTKTADSWLVYKSNNPTI